MYPPNRLEVNLTAQHIELCNTSGVHFDCVVRTDGLYSTDFPFEEETSHSYVNLI